MITYPGAMNEFSFVDIPLESLRRAKHLHFSSYFLQPGLKSEVGKLFLLAKEFGLTTSLDTQWDPDEKWDLDMENVLPHVDIFLPNEKEIYKLTRKNTLLEALEVLQNKANTVVVKRGSRGSVSWHKGNLKYQDPFLNDQVVDAIGAGDSFNAGYIYKFLQGDTVCDCQKFGNLIGAISTTRAGGTAAFVDYDNIMTIAEERFGYVTD
jgi:sugar/nucleoside kinase (ribokinase family)